MKLKLRAWHDNKMWGPIGVLHMDFPGWISDFPSDVELMTWTGLLDRNGAEIYEGDSVRYQADFGTEQYPDDRTITDVVRFEGGAFYPVCNQPGETFEVIGNTYEGATPEGE